MNRLKLQGFLLGKFVVLGLATITVPLVYGDIDRDVVALLGVLTAASGFLSLWVRIGRIEEAQARGYRAAVLDMRQRVDITRPSEPNVHRLPVADGTLRTIRRKR